MDRPPKRVQSTSSPVDKYTPPPVPRDDDPYNWPEKEEKKQACNRGVYLYND